MMSSAITPNTLTTAVLSILMVSALVLTFTNDKHLATIFHDQPFWWSLLIHGSIIAFPPIMAFTRDKRERQMARALWLVALAVALLGNIAGSLAHAAAVPMRDVLDGWPQISDGAALAAIIGGCLLVGIEGVVGWLWERSIARLIAGDRDVHERATSFTDEASDVQSLAPWLAPLTANEADEVHEVHEKPVNELDFVHERREQPVNEEPEVRELEAPTANEEPEVHERTTNELNEEEREALLVIKHAVNPCSFTTGEASEASPWAKTRTSGLLAAALDAGILNKVGRGQWAFAQPENGRL